MKVKLDTYTCTIEREPGDNPIRRFSPGYYPFDPDSSLLYAVKNELHKQGYDVVKKRVQADGHLFGYDGMQYIRDRRGAFAVVDGSYALRIAVEDYNRDGTVTLDVYR